MKRLSLVVCEFQEDLADFGFQSAEIPGKAHLSLWDKRPASNSVRKAEHVRFCQ